MNNMINEFLSSTLIFGSIIFLSMLIDIKKSYKYWYVLLLFLVIAVIDSMFYPLTMRFQNIQIIDPYVWNNNLTFNWSAKLYSILFALILLVPLKPLLSANNIGLTLHQNKNSLKFSLFVVLFFFIVATILGLLSGKAPFDINPLLYTAIMPGLAEELIYRGLLLGLLNKLFDRKFKILGTNFGWGAILTSIAFGLVHGFQLGEGFQIQLDFITVILTGVYGFLYALLKERSGSLLFPIIGHGTVDFFNFFFRMI